MSDGPIERTQDELTAWPPWLFRFIHVLGGAAWIAFGFVIAALLPERWDPIGLRAAMAGCTSWSW